jgi:hypothetical protein
VAADLPLQLTFDLRARNAQFQGFIQAMKGGIANPPHTPADRGRRILRLVGIWQRVTK